MERIVHYAKNANENKLVMKYAPLAAKQAASVGAHIEASKLYLTAIEYSEGNDTNQLVEFYAAYAYECYLTNQVKEAIIYTNKSLNTWKEKNDMEQVGNCMRFLSRLWWMDGNREKARSFGEQAVDVLHDMPSSRIKAMAFSNMSHLKMLFDQAAACIDWGEKAIAIAREVADEETLSHALNNVGAVQMLMHSSQKKGSELLKESLNIALKNSYHEHAARAYTNLASIAIKIKNYGLAKSTLDEGIQYCEERGLNSWTLYLLSLRSKLHLETGNWNEALTIAEAQLKNENLTIAVTVNTLLISGTIKMRRGEDDPLPLLLEAKRKAFEIMEMQRIIPSLIGLLEYEWLTGKSVLDKEEIERTIGNIGQTINDIENSELAFWLLKVRKQPMPVEDYYEAYEVSNVTKARKAAAQWVQIGCPYQQSLSLFAGNEEDKKNAISIVHQLGATAVFEKMKFEMRSIGIKNIPRGIRKSTQLNPALLTGREMDVLQLLHEGLQNKEIAARIFISPKTVDHHISSILFKLDVNSRTRAVTEAVRLGILK